MAGAPNDASVDVGSEDDAAAAARSILDLDDPCRQTADAAEWIDRMQRGVYRSVCGSARWIDTFFGDDRSFRDQDRTFGRLGLRLLYDEVDEIKVRAKFKAKLSLPRLEDRWNAFVGRFDEEEFITEQPSEDSTFGLPSSFRETTDQDWLVGLGYSPHRSARNRFDFDAGIKLDFPSDPYVRGRYTAYLLPYESALIRFRQSVFWRREKSLGTSTLLDLEQTLGSRFHLRWRSVGTVAERDAEGVDWYSSVTLYQGLDERRAFAYTLGVDGETDAPTTIQDYGLRVLYRQQMHREWLFLELRGSLAFKREEEKNPDQDRERALGFGVGFEMRFGDWRR
ncbi:MAG: hypothetical protein AAGN46_12710 [Acidobacteriota bacterium]